MRFPLPLARTGASLTVAERDVVRRVLGGASNAAIARARGTSPRTVANQVASAFEKLGVSSRARLARQLASSDLDDALEGAEA